MTPRLRRLRPAAAAAALFVALPADGQRRTPRDLVQRALGSLGGEAAARSVNNLALWLWPEA